MKPVKDYSRVRYDFIREYCNLYQMPTTARAAYIQIDALHRWAQCFRKCDPGTAKGTHYSKRRARLVRMFHAFRKLEG